MLLSCLVVSLCAVAQKEVVIKGNTQISSAIDPELSLRFFQMYSIIESFLENERLEIRERVIPRSLREVSQGLADFHFPLICAPLKNEAARFLRQGKETLGESTFTLITAKTSTLSRQKLFNAEYKLDEEAISGLSGEFSLEDKNKLSKQSRPSKSRSEFKTHIHTILGRDLTKAQIEEIELAAFPYKVVLERAHQHMIDIPSLGTYGPENALHMVISGRADALIENILSIKSTMENEPSLKGSFRVTSFESFPVCFIVAKTPRGEYVEGKLSLALKKAKQTERAKEIIDQLSEYEKIYTRLLNKNQ